MKAHNKFKNVILIDDEKAINYYHQYMIKNLEITDNIIVLQNVDDVPEQLRLFLDKEDIQPSILFVDLRMPKYNGFELIEKYQDLFQALKDKNVPIIMLTTSDHPKDVANAVASSIINEYHQKPMTEEMLIELVETYC